MVDSLYKAAERLLDEIDRFRLHRITRKVERAEQNYERTRMRVEEAYFDLVKVVCGHDLDEDTRERHADYLKRLLDDIENAELGDMQASAL